MFIAFTDAEHAWNLLAVADRYSIKIGPCTGNIRHRKVVDPEKAKQRLFEVMSAIQQREISRIPIVILKQRQRQSAKKQYGKN